MSSYYLLIEEDEVIATDIIEALGEVAPRVEVAHFRDLDMGVAEVGHRGAPRAAIVNWPYYELGHSRLDELVTTFGGKVIVTRGAGKNQDAARPHWILLPKPFTSEMLKAALQD